MTDGPDIICWTAPRARCFNHCEWSEIEPGIFAGLIEVPVPDYLRPPPGWLGCEIRPCKVLDAVTGELLSPTDAVDRREGLVRRLVDQFGKPGISIDRETGEHRRVWERRQCIVVPRADC
ncbi:MAG TPA: hypothetical protein VG125_33875 [Pirellulales bacterium]|jgi:hypothetical protein|nr:hypothetical protein [Pirellulales bacterium]